MNIDLMHKGTMVSVLGRDPVDGTLGIALASSSMAVGSRCPHIDVGRAAVTSQGFTNLKVGPLALDLVRCGLTALEVLEALRQHDRWLDYRQIAIMTADGQVEAHTGSMATGWAGHLAGENVLCLGNGIVGGTDALVEAVTGFALSRALRWRNGCWLLWSAQSRGSARRFGSHRRRCWFVRPRRKARSTSVSTPAYPDRTRRQRTCRPARAPWCLSALLDIYAARSVAPRSF